jgi:hypothetical protein
MLSYKIHLNEYDDGVNCAPVIMFMDEQGNDVPFILPDYLELSKVKDSLHKFAEAMIEKYSTIEEIQKFLYS